MTAIVNDELVFNPIRPESLQTTHHDYLDQTRVIKSKTQELDGAIVYVKRIVDDWRENKAPHADILIRRVLAPHFGFNPGTTIYQVEIRVQGPSASDVGPYRSPQGIWVCQEEIGKAYNKGRNKSYADTSTHDSGEVLSRAEKAEYLFDPTKCPFSNCEIKYPTFLVGVSIKRHIYKAKYECPHCEGEWTESLVIEGVK